MNWKLVTLTTACWGLVLYVICVVWGLMTPEVLHMHGFLEHLLPGFAWISLPMFFLGLVESFLFGAYAGAIFAWIYNILSSLRGD
jgi:uncharacterized protein DUF5676